MNKKPALVVCVCLLAAVGCKGKSGIVGEWAGSEPSVMGSGSKTDVAVKFNADGSYSVTTGSGQFALETDGTYTYDDTTKQLTLNQQKIKMGGKDLKVTGNAFSGPGAPVKVTWKSDDEMSATLGMSEADLKRK